MAQIHILDSVTIDKIAAGEVVERPSSVVKELVENAIDAGADAITVEAKEGGIEFIRITDNGCGMEPSQVRTAFLRHATSKIENAEDLITVTSLGFRGEALSSIAAVSKVEMITKTRAALTGVRLILEGSVEKSFEEVGAPEGTTIIMRNLFYNTPARRKFLKQPASEGAYIADLMEHMALSRPDISFKLILGRQERFHTSGNGDLKEVIYRIYGRDIAMQLVPIQMEEEGIRVDGYLGKPVLMRSNRNFEIYFLNGRFIKSKLIAQALEEGYKEYLMQHRFPLCILHIQVDSEKVDVNVHPAKMDVRVFDGATFCSTLTNMVSNTLIQKEMIPDVETEPERKPVTESKTSVLGPNISVPERNISGTESKISGTDPMISTPESKISGTDPMISTLESKISGTDPMISTPESKILGTDPMISTPEPMISAPESMISIPEPKTSTPEPFEVIRTRQNRVMEEVRYEAEKPKMQDYMHNPVWKNVYQKQELDNSVDNEGTPSKKPDEDFFVEAVPPPEIRDKQDKETGITAAAGTQEAERPPMQLSLFEEKMLTIENRSRYRIIGQVFDTYWLLQFEDQLYMIDQHAAHEKVKYERLMKQYHMHEHEREAASQNLMPPVIVSLTGQEEAILKEYLDIFHSLGFEIESFGGSEYALRSVPVDLYGCGEREMFLDVLEELCSGSSRKSPRVVEEKIASMACKAAVKGNRRISLAEAEKLIDELLTLDHPYNCPHGRPVIITMSKAEMEKKFKRII